MRSHVPVHAAGQCGGCQVSGASSPLVYLLDDEAAVVVALDRLLRAAGFSTAPFCSAGEFLRHVDPQREACLVLDMAMPGMDGLTVQQMLADRDVCVGVVFLTGRADVPMTVHAMKAGACDLLTKPVDGARLIDAVNAALARSAKERAERARRAELAEKFVTLTPRERQVMAQVVSGRMNKQIAASLGAAEKTIKVHRGRVMQKMGVESLADLVRAAQCVGLEAE